ncbi:MAG TPA: SCO family protein [Porticoccaceae bacterium]|nr:SCO family protein [Porticoccaceae bacterium]
MKNPFYKKKPRRNIRLVIVGVLAFAALTLASLVNKLSQPRILNAYELRDYGALLLDQHQPVPAFALSDHDGKAFDQTRLQGQLTIIFFGFTSCGDICPTTMAELAKTYAELEPEIKQAFQVVLVTVDPDRDTPARLKTYVQGFDQSFIGVTGGKSQLIAMASALKVPYSPVLDPEAGDQEPQHSPNLVLINPAGELHGYFRPPLAHGSLRVVWRSLNASYQG